MRGVPPPPRVNPIILSRAASENKDFCKHYLSGSTNLSFGMVLVVVGFFAAFLFVLWLMD